MTMTYYVAQAPANIAFLKYWGRLSKRPRVASTPSLSMSLSQAVTTTMATCGPAQEFDELGLVNHLDAAGGLSYSYQADSAVVVQGYGAEGGGDKIVIHGLSQTEFKQSLMLAHACERMVQHLRFVKQQIGVVKPLQIITTNNFAMAAGIASSASGFAALTMAAVGCLYGCVGDELVARGMSAGQLSHLAREGSGSAARSIYGGYVSWLPPQQNPSDSSYLCHPGHPGQIVQEFEATHWPLADTIVVLSTAAKPVSSSAGHDLAPTSHLYAVKVARGYEKWLAFKSALRAKSISQLGPLIEAEALEMHGVAMSTSPPTNYLCSQTVRLLSWLCEQRAAGVFEAYFTIDAGPNVHVISEPDQVPAVIAGIRSQFEVEEIICDGVGDGSELMVTHCLDQVKTKLTQVG